MKKILLLLFVTVFTLDCFSQGKYPELAPLKNLSSLDSKSSKGLDTKFVRFLNSKNTSASKSNLDLPNTLSSNTSLTGKTKEAKRPATTKSPFRFNVTPYFWAAGVTGTVSVPGIPQPYPQEYNLNVSFSQVWKHIHFGFMINGNFRYDDWALLYDVIYINLKGFDVSRSNSDSILSANTTNKELVMDYAISYFVPMKSTSIFINPYAGVRVTSMESEITLNNNITDTTIMASGSFTWVDPIIGFNAELNIKPVYSYYRLDLGGFGINSHFTINFVGGLGYRFSPDWDISLGYKILGTNYHKENKWDVGQGGLLFAVGYRFNP